MRFALVNGERSEPKPQLRGVCTNCGSEMVAKCGRYKVWHWAHKARTMCDPWWESETEWHRAWKDEFPTEWQEVRHEDPPTGEAHIADVKNPYGLVIEIQHSPIDPVELQVRECFYGEMIWIVDAREVAGHFWVGLSGPIQYDPLAYGFVWWGRSRFPHGWSEATKKVYLDLGDTNAWRLVTFDRDKKVGVLGPLPKKTLIEDCRNGTEIRIAVGEEGDPRLQRTMEKIER